ncbi:MAG: hypothetical protein EB051_00150 [Chlamydiia bacterium]|jgi:hypothetical protein|nr:hypothetical protein [Chlamydiia bacterium]
MSTTSLRTVISGSYRRHLRELYELKQEIEKLGILVLSPVGSAALNPEEEFIFLDEDPIHDKRLLQDSIFAKIRTSSFLLLANFDGYAGKAAVMEVGYALAFGLQILSIEPVEDPNIRPYTRLLNEAFPKFQFIKRQELLCKI